MVTSRWHSMADGETPRRILITSMETSQTTTQKARKRSKMDKTDSDEDSSVVTYDRFFVITPSTPSLCQPVYSEPTSLSQPVACAGQSVDTGEACQKSRRLRNKKLWKRNIRKCLKNRGKAYVSSSGKTVSERQIGSGCGVKCRLECHESFSRGTRQEILDKFWNIGNINQQRQFITDHVHRKPSKKSRIVYSYSLTMCDQQIRVCKVFFLETLGIKEDTVYGAC